MLAIFTVKRIKETVPDILIGDHGLKQTPAEKIRWNDKFFRPLL
jgi:hypothetical protein